MKYTCAVGKMKEINALSEKYYTRRIKELNLQVLGYHTPLFYSLPETGEWKLYNDICREWGISKSSISDIINKYVKLGFVSKCPCKEDKRTIYISLTDEGLRIKQQLHSIEDEILSQLFVEFSETQKEKFDKDLDIILNSLNKI